MLLQERSVVAFTVLILFSKAMILHKVSCNVCYYEIISVSKQH